MRLVILFNMLLNPSFKMTTGVANISRSTATTSKFLYTKKDFKSSWIGSLYEKQFLISNEVKTSLMLKCSLQNSLLNFESLFLIWCDICPIYGNLK